MQLLAGGLRCFCMQFYSFAQCIVLRACSPLLILHDACIHACFFCMVASVHHMDMDASDTWLMVVVKAFTMPRWPWCIILLRRASMLDSPTVTTNNRSCVGRGLSEEQNADLLVACRDWLANTAAPYDNCIRIAVPPPSTHLRAWSLRKAVYCTKGGCHTMQGWLDQRCHFCSLSA